MFARLGMYQTVAIGAVVVAVGGWALYTQTDLFKPAPIVQASDTPIAVEAEADAPSAPDNETADVNEIAEEASDAAVEDEEAQETSGTEDAMDDAPVAQEDAVEEQAVTPLPAFDVVRVEADGTTVVAGTGPAGWMISVLVDDVVVETVEADSTGQFVAFLDLGTSDQARVMTLSAKNGDAVLLSTAQILIAPVVQVAEAQPESVDAPIADDTAEGLAVDAVDTATVAAENVEAETAVDNMVSTDTEATPEATQATQEVASATDDTPEASDEIAVDVTTEQTLEVADAETLAENTASAETEAAMADDEAQDTATQSEAAMADTAEAVVTQVYETGETTETPEVDDQQATELAAESDATDSEDAQSAPAVVLVEDDSVTVLQPANVSPTVLDELSIAAISYSETGAVQLSGFSPAGFLRVYLNNIQIAILEVPNAGSWSTELVDVEPGVYTLRVDQVDADGNVQQRVETPFQREEPEKVVAATQTRRPLVTSQVVQPGSTLWAISRENYGSGVLFVRIFEANKDQIRDPDLIYPGQIFDLPAPPGARKTR